MKKYALAVKATLPLVLATAASQPAMAADNVRLENGSLELTVTANRREQLTSTTLAPVTLISREDIEQSQASTMAEVLSRVPGISLSNSGGLGKATSVFIRGTNSGQALVLIDGVRHGSATLGSTAFQHIPIDQIERIEIVRGPRSSLYGSDAVGGVIQIFTRKGSRGFNPSIALSMGSHDTYIGNASFAGGNDKTRYNLSLERQKSKGIDACNSSTSGCFADEPDKDGYKRNSVTFNVSHAFNDAVKGQISLLRALGDNEFDGGFQNQSTFTQQVINAKLNADVSRRLSLQFSLGQSKDDSDNFKDGAFTGNFDTKRDTFSALADYNINDNHTVLFGADWYDDNVSSKTKYDISSRDNTGIFTSYLGQFNRTQLDVSLRYDDNEQFGSKTTGGISVGQQFGNGMRLKAAYGTAFKAPTFNQLYFPKFGNAKLKPEESKNYEISVDGPLRRGSWEVNVFQNDIDNLIAGFPVSNIAKARIRGIEGIVSTKLAGFDLSSNLTLQKPEAQAGKNKGKILRVRPERIFNLNVDRKFGRFSVGSTIHAESERFTKADNSDKLGGFTRVDLRAAYAVAKDWTVGLKVENALDKDYALNKGFNQDGASAMLTVRFAPK